MTKKTESPRPEARLPKGLQDISSAEIRATEAMLGTIKEVFERYGFEPLDTPAIEYTDALGKFLPDQDRPNEGVFSFQDDDEQWLSLRYDLTAPLARYVAENYQTLPKPLRRYQVGPVWRNEKPGPGRFRQFMQFDADTVGAPSVAADAELCMLAADTLEALGIPRGEYVVRVNNRKVLDGVLEGIGVTDEAQRLVVLRALDKRDRLGKDGVAELLGKGRTDESGDRTKGADLDQAQIDVLLSMTDPSAAISSDPTVDEIKERSRVTGQDRAGLLRWGLPLYPNHSVLENEKLAEGTKELTDIQDLCVLSGYLRDRIRVDASIVRGLEYYTGPVFEAELTAPIKDKRGQATRLGSVVSGGRYDGLVERFTGEKVPATGISVGVSRLLFGLQLLGKFKGDAVQGPVVVLVFDKDRMADYQKMAQELRNANIRAELYLGESNKMGAQLKYANKRGSPCVVIQGSTERDDPEGPKVTIKDLVLGATLTSIEDREEYLKKQAEAQFAVPEAELVAAVKKVLARHKAQTGNAS